MAYKRKTRERINQETKAAMTREREREAITDWKNWRDIFASETVVEPGAYKRKVLHTWTRRSYGAHDRPGAMLLTSYASVKGHHTRTSLDVTLTPQAIETIRTNTLHIDRDTITVEVIVWDDGRALVVAQHSNIIGGTWLAKIDASTIPTFPRRFEVRSADGLEAAFDDESDAEKYAAELRGNGAADVTVEPE